LSEYKVTVKKIFANDLKLYIVFATDIDVTWCILTLSVLIAVTNYLI